MPYDPARLPGRQINGMEPEAAMSETLLPSPWFDLVLILALVALNGLLSMSELAIVSSREARLKAMAKAGSSGANCALTLAAEPGRLLSTVQIGITLIGILAGAYSGASLGEPVAQRLALLGMDPETAKSVGLGLVIVVTTFASLIIGELVPKQFALRNPEAIAVMKGKGLLAVEMEAAALYAFAQARNKPVLCFAHVTNQMGQIEGDFEKGEANGTRNALDVILAAARGWLQAQRD